MNLLRKLWHRTGRRGTFLLFFSFLWISTGWRWTEEPPPSENYATLYKVMPPEAWGWVFVGTGIVMGLGSHWKQIEYISFSVSAYLGALLGTMILLGYWPGNPGPADTGLTISLTYFLYTTFILIISGWPEAPVKPRESKDKDGS